MRYFLTGATGFLGKHLARQLVVAGHDVVAIVRRPDQARDLADLGVDVRRGDITDRDSLREPMRGADGVYHVAGWYKLGARDKSAAWPVNVDGTRNVLEVMSDLSIPRGVYTSSLAIFSDTHSRVPDETYTYDGPHLSAYDHSKWAAHYEVAVPMIEAGLPLIIAQPGVIYGPGDTSLIRDTWTQYLRRRLPAIPRGTAYCWGHVDDIANGHVLAMERGTPGETYIVAGEPRTLFEVLVMAEAITGIPAPRILIDGRWLRMLAGLVEPVERVVPLPETYTSDALRSSAGVTYLGSNQKAVRDLGFSNRPLEEGLRETLTWEMERLGMEPPAR